MVMLPHVLRNNFDHRFTSRPDMDVYPHMVINDDLDVCHDAFQPMLGLGI